MNNKLGILFVVSSAGCAAVGALCVALAAMGALHHPMEEDYLFYGFIGSLGGLFLTGLVHGLVTEFYRVDFRRYLLRVMALTTRKGLSLGHAFLALAEDYDGPRRRTVYRILGLLDEGRPLSEALETGAPKIVPPYIIEAIRAAERNGGLAETLEAALEESLAARSYRGLILRSLCYPVAIVGVGLFLTTFILPQFGAIFAQLADGDGYPLRLPASTRFALFAGDLVSSYVLPFGGILLLLLSPFLLGRVRHRFRWALDPLALRLPFLGRLRLLLAGERICRTLAGNVRAGTTLEEALTRAGAGSGSLPVQRSAEEAVAAIRAGTPADRALQELRLPLFVRARAAAASGGTPERFAAALDGLARECQWRRIRLGEILAGSIYPVTLVFGASTVFLMYYGVFKAISTLQGALIPW
jgi:type II secretory pathway component PulF